MVAGNDGANLIAGGEGAGRLLHAAGGGDDELVGRQHQLGRQSLARLRMGGEQQTPAAFAGRSPCFGRRQSVDGLPRLGGGDQRGVAVAVQIETELTGAP